VRDHRRQSSRPWWLAIVVAVSTTLGVVTLVYPRPAANAELPNRIPEAAPYVIAEAEFFPPPFEESWHSNSRTHVQRPPWPSRAR